MTDQDTPRNGHSQLQLAAQNPVVIAAAEAAWGACRAFGALAPNITDEERTPAWEDLSGEERGHAQEDALAVLGGATAEQLYQQYGETLAWEAAPAHVRLPLTLFRNVVIAVGTTAHALSQAYQANQELIDRAAKPKS